MTTIGFLHTSPAHQSTFDSLVAELTPSVEARAIVDEVILNRARLLGADHVEIVGAIADRLAQLHDTDVVVCTCSTIGAVAEWIGAEAGVRVIRIDRPMAELAVAGYERIAVVAAVESTVESTRELLEDVARLAGKQPTVDVHLVADAWERFEAGDLDGYLVAVASAVDAAAEDADVVVLAQASMAGAVEHVTADVPVLTSPKSAIEFVATLLVAEA